MALTDGLTILQNIFQDTLVFGIDWFVSLILIILTLLLITRNTNDWPILALPVTVAWHVVGITPSFLWYIIASIMFTVNLLSLKNITNITTKIRSLGSEAYEKNKEIVSKAAKTYPKRSKEKGKMMRTLLDAISKGK